MRVVCCIVGCIAIVISTVVPCCGQTEFRKALQKKYNFKSVNCFTCHMRKRDVSPQDQAAFKEKPKSFRNAFGKEFDNHLKGKDVTERLAAVKKLKKDDPQKKAVVDSVVAEFLTALNEVEKVQSPEGPTYGQLLQQAKLDGVKPRK